MMPLSLDQAITLAAYIISTSITPGPGNIISAASGVHFGWRRSIPQVCGVTASLCTVTLLALTCLASLLQKYPNIALTIALLGILFMLYLAVQLIRSAAPLYTHCESKPTKAFLPRPLKFHQSYLAQLSNPKIWIMALTINANYTNHTDTVHNLLIILYVAVMNFPCIFFWAWLGSRPRRYAHSAHGTAWLNLFMGICLAITSLWILKDVLSRHAR